MTHATPLVGSANLLRIVGSGTDTTAKIDRDASAGTAEDGLIDVQDGTFVTLYGYAVAASYALGHVSLLAAFAVGLPALDESDEDAVDEDAVDVEDGRSEVGAAILDEDGWPISPEPGG